MWFNGVQDGNENKTQHHQPQSTHVVIFMGHGRRLDNHCYVYSTCGCRKSPQYAIHLLAFVSERTLFSILWIPILPRERERRITFFSSIIAKQRGASGVSATNTLPRCRHDRERHRNLMSTMVLDNNIHDMLV